MTTSYDKVAYPTAIFQQTHPERMAVLATLHGLSPPDVRTARVMEIGCGDGMNLLALAAAYPEAEFFGFDLAETAIDRGKELAKAAGIKNVRLETLDILNAQAVIQPKGFDYVSAHGVYAWVPEEVRGATMALVGHSLSDHGVAFVSYNALPGGHIRMIMRDMLFHVLEGIDQPDTKIAATRAFLSDFATAREGDDPVVTAIRAQAASMLDRPDNVLFHDELGPAYAPQSISDVVKAGTEVGLSFLSDAGRNLHLQGFLQEEVPAEVDPEVEVVRRVQTDDYVSMRFFRQTLFIRSSAMPSRQIDTRRLSGLYASCSMTRNAEGAFVSGHDVIEISDDGLAAAIDRLGSIFPERLLIEELALEDGQRRALIQLYAEWYVRFHLSPAPFALEVSDRPVTSPLSRAQFERGDRDICTLDHQFKRIDQPELRRLLGLADGTRTLAELQAIPNDDIAAEQIPQALLAAARHGFLVKRPDFKPEGFAS